MKLIISLLLVASVATAATVERQIDRLLLGTDANGGGNSITNLARVETGALQLGGTSRTNWPADAAPVSISGGSNVVIVLAGTNYTVHVPSLPWTAITDAPSFEAAGAAAAQMLNLSNTFNNALGSIGAANSNYFAASNWVLVVSATDMQNLSNTVFNAGFLTGSATQSVFHLGAPNVVTSTNTFRSTLYVNDALRINRWFTNAGGDTCFAIQTPGASVSMGRWFYAPGTGTILRTSQIQLMSTNGVINFTFENPPVTNTTVAGFGINNGTLTGLVSGGITEILSTAGPITTNSSTSVTLGAPTNASALANFPATVPRIVARYDVSNIASLTITNSSFGAASNSTLIVYWENLYSSRNDISTDSITVALSGTPTGTNHVGYAASYGTQFITGATKTNAWFFPLCGSYSDPNNATTGHLQFGNLFNTNTVCKTCSGKGMGITGGYAVESYDMAGRASPIANIVPNITLTPRFGTSFWGRLIVELH